MTRTIRRLDLPEIRSLLDWATAEGWNPGLDDAQPFAAADPEGFLGAFVGGTMVAGISAIAYDDRFGFIGLYICHPAWRGQGHGKAVWDAAMAYLGNRTIGLDGVPEQQANYARMGFVADYETIRMSGTLEGPTHGGDGVGPADIGTLDRSCFPAIRGAFLRQWLAPPRGSFVHRTNGVVDGYAISRLCRDGRKLGPLFAQSQEAALDIISRQSGLTHIDVPADQARWIATLTGLGFTAGFATRRMYKGPPPSVRKDWIFGITSLELG